LLCSSSLYFCEPGCLCPLRLVQEAVLVQLTRIAARAPILVHFADIAYRGDHFEGHFFRIVHRASYPLGFTLAASLYILSPGPPVPCRSVIDHIAQPCFQQHHYPCAGRNNLGGRKVMAGLFVGVEPTRAQAFGRYPTSSIAHAVHDCCRREHQIEWKRLVAVSQSAHACS
jgi:hypothetical protein